MFRPTIFASSERYLGGVNQKEVVVLKTINTCMCSLLDSDPDELWYPVRSQVSLTASNEMYRRSTIRRFFRLISAKISNNDVEEDAICYYYLVFGNGKGKILPYMFRGNNLHSIAWVLMSLREFDLIKDFV